MARRDDDREGDRLVPADPAEVTARNEPPVVARLVVEIRSDGRHTIARGAMEESGSGHGVAIEASGHSPLQLALSLARALFTLPAFGRSAARAILRGPHRGPRQSGQSGQSGGGEGGGARQ